MHLDIIEAPQLAAKERQQHVFESSDDGKQWIPISVYVKSKRFRQVMASNDDVSVTTVTDDGAGMSQAMSINDKVVVKTALQDGADMPMAINDKVATPMTPEMDGDQMSLHDENQSPYPSISLSQIDGNTDDYFRVFLPKPPSLLYAKVQGFERLREMLNDPNGEIAHNIQKTSGWNVKTLASNEKCKKVRQFITGEKKALPITDDTVPFVLATWCMLGGFVPSMWREKVEGEKPGCGPLTDWGKKMIDELEHLGGSGEYKFELCNQYATKTVGRKHDFDWTEAAKRHYNLDDDAEQARKKSSANAQATSLGKHRASSPRQTPAAKRPKSMAPRQGRGSHDDDTEDEEVRVEVKNDAMGAGKKKDMRVSKTPITLSSFNRPGFPRTQVAKHDHRGQNDVPPPPQQIWESPSAQRGQGLEDNPSNSSISRPFGRDLNISNVSSTTTSMDWNSQRRKGGSFVEEPTAPGGTTGMPSSSYRSPTASSGQPLLQVGSALLQGPTASSGRPPLDESTPESSISGVQQGDLREDKQGPTVQSRHSWAFIEQIENLKESAQNEVNKQIDHYKSLNSKLKKNLSASYEDIEAKEDKIAALKKEVKIWRRVSDNKEQLESRIMELEAASKGSQQREALLKRTSALNILQKASTTGKELGTIFLAQLLDEMDGGDGTCASGVEGS